MRHSRVATETAGETGGRVDESVGGGNGRVVRCEQGMMEEDGSGGNIDLFILLPPTPSISLRAVAAALALVCACWAGRWALKRVVAMVMARARYDERGVDGIWSASWVGFGTWLGLELEVWGKRGGHARKHAEGGSSSMLTWQALERAQDEVACVLVLRELGMWVVVE
ncbi:hypothetical protein DEU56DRAFT_757897 [Suillus clintonianus]|uniref:uncharacterized protein n=1 Tax=Suillus clintonianus TaxID=1904413 RepID=UPI001B866F04|nr:uncharacterized protein DEU56DRAFT_757897 [Suillus clintonianus]KAG2130221.1 hypothetical protein DEU56DRAFT_757897 [Suillus clintonianus]